ncbi:relaxase/mobilization nuclease domain-containing protein [Algoriphagus sp. D3-2-R+10]|uniref:relaxase/mobilization nuclease domain-containing protein n=1 Tax=Algoriphagus aurantiacus TaxID=3103948 RepID=UPI002B3E50AF|nr:relaxase/mobilization nuclease domain-containing protein [Algoriphagus sp. D3-2-R+10]MEB2778113.1 relaxase/mobilization nuclease domain-containing protein [Algoriphagus sp. D3-2-R+10]
MVAKIITGKTVGGAVRYNEQKVSNGKARLLEMKGFALRNLSVGGKIQVFKELQKLNKRTKTNTVHISLNFSPKDQLGGDKLRKIVSDYMKGIGFGQQPYLLYQHLDAAHPHVHIVTANIDNRGKRIETHNLGKILSEKTRKEIEKHYGLIKAEDQKKQIINLIQPLEKAAYGKSETKAAISNIVREVTRTYRFTSIPELNAVLGQFNVCAYGGEKESEMYRNKGLIYSVLDSVGNRIGVPIKASAIYSKPTLTNLEKCFVRNQEDRKTFRNDLRESILESIDQCNSPDELSDRLRSKGIRPVFRINEEGRLYGVTYVDNVSRSVFNGSSLDKALSANALAIRFSSKSLKSSIPDHSGNYTPEVAKINLPDSSLMINTYQAEDPIPYELRQKKKKKRRKLNL